MKKKYRLFVIFLTMGIMLIGSVTFYIGKDAVPSKRTNTQVNSNKADSDSGDSENVADKGDGSEDTDNSEGGNTEGLSLKIESDGTYVLEENKYPEINSVVEKYLNASVMADMDALSSVVSNTSHIDREALREKYRYVERYENISCYTLECPNESGYRVYVYGEIKLSGIDTLAPGLSSLYVTQTDQGDYCVYLDVLDSEVQEFIDKADESMPVQKLMEQVEYRFKEVLGRNEQLKKLQEQMSSS